jgi:hypothetical protein
MTTTIYFSGPKSDPKKDLMCKNDLISSVLNCQIIIVLKIYKFYGKIWVNLQMDDHHFGYIIKLTTPKKALQFSTIVVGQSSY